MRFAYCILRMALQKLGVDSRTQAVIAIDKIGASSGWPRLPG